MRRVDAVFGGRPVCGYATGSYGRLEATGESDLDVFFLYDGASGGRELRRSDAVRLLAAAVTTADRLGFEPLTDRFLEVHDLQRMETALGSPEDDMDNAFTARMLMLLESRPIYNAGEFERMLDAVIGFYYRDYAGHETDFVPMFLLNDVLRYWRTLCLNYEQKWASRAVATPELKADRAYDNLKLRFNRLWTCFSFIAPLAAAPPGVHPDDVVKLARTTPVDRFGRLGKNQPAAGPIVERLLQRYAWWLAQVAKPSALKESLKTPARRQELRGEARGLGDDVYELLQTTLPSERLRPLLV